MSQVTLILLNELFRFLVTASVSSTITIWDVWRGRKVNLITRAHTRVEHGELQLASITAGCFDPKHQFLLTAGDRTALKVWNFNEGICLRSIDIEGGVVAVFWGHQRIFAMGSGRRVVEFNDSSSVKEQLNRGKQWARWHRGHIICAAIREPDVIVTGCTAGDLIFWRYETGQPYMRFSVEHPTHRLQIVDIKKFDERRSEKVPEGKRMTMKTKENLTLRGLQERLENL